jgi:ferredoxin
MSDIKYKIVFKNPLCIGALACSAIDPEIWEPTPDGKVTIKGGQKVLNDKGEVVEEFIILDELPVTRMDGAMSCPVLAIEIYKIKDGKEEKLYPKTNY